MGSKTGDPAPLLPGGTVTLLLGDIVGSVSRWEADREAMSAAMIRFEQLVSEFVRRYGGVLPLEQGEGDSFVAGFSRASDGIGCALGLQRAIVGEDWPGESELTVRMALNTGEVGVAATTFDGPVINRCARLRDLAHGGQILVARTTRDLVEQLPEQATFAGLGTHRLRDLARPEDVYQLCHPDLPTTFPSLRSLDAFPNNLPTQLTSFIGRGDAIVALRSLIAEARLVTLTGAGGCGKTRLCLQVAADRLDDYPDGVCWVDLAPSTDPRLVVSALAASLSVKEVAGQDLADTRTVTDENGGGGGSRAVPDASE